MKVVLALKSIRLPRSKWRFGHRIRVSCMAVVKPTSSSSAATLTSFVFGNVRGT